MLILPALLCSMIAMAQVPAGYYNSLNGKSGQALKDAVSDLTLRRTVHSYGSLWTYFPQTDCKPSDPRQVWDMYSNRTYYFSSHVGNSTSGMNKEHALPKSWWGGYDENDGYIAYTDLNHLYPSDADANTAKLHYPMGEVSTAKFDNGCTRVGTPKTGHGGGSSMVFEPDDRYKGDFARTYFYMAATYQAYDWKYTWMMRNTTSTQWLSLQPWAITMLLQWARQDPVSDKEKARNDAVFRCQNNRNPFIDNPELVEYIWGAYAGETFQVGQGSVISGDPELVTPIQNAEYHLGEVALGQSVSIVVYVKANSLRGDLEVMLYRDDKDQFSASVSRIDKEIACSADGYALTVTYRPTALGDHKTRLVISDGGLQGSVGIGLDGRCLPVPSLQPVEALPPLEVTDSTYVAQWTPSSDEVDFYVVTRTIYDSHNRVVDSESFTTDDDTETVMPFTRAPGHIHTYSVQSSRLGYLSPAGNVITLDDSGISGVEADRPVALLATEGGVLVKCSEPLHDVDIFTIAGSHVLHMEQIENDQIISLPAGIYILTSRSTRQAVKIVITQ